MMKTIFENDFLSFGLNAVGIPFLKMNKKGLVIVPVIQSTGKLALIKKERLGSMTLEFPRGFGSEIKDIKSFNYYFDETKILTKDSLGLHQADTGIMDNPVNIQTVEFEEEVQHDDVMYVTLAELAKLVDENKITCGYTLSAAMKYISRITLRNE